jgi:DNA invertase Pin-like site-specific DNA recombinase
MIDACLKGKHEMIVCYALDRFSRSANAAIQQILKLSDHGIGFASATQHALNLASDMPMRRSILAIFAELAEMERETIVSRVKDGLAAAKKRGVKLGAPTKIKPDHVKAVKKMKGLGYTYKEINEHTKLSVGSIAKILKGLNEGCNKS